MQIHRVYIKATAEAIWDAVTKPDWTERYGYGGRAEYDLRPGGAFRSVATEAMQKQGKEMGYDVPDVLVEGEVVEAEPPRRLVQTWRLLMDPSIAAEPFTRLTYEIDEVQPGVCRLTVTHDVSESPQTAALIAGEREAEGAGGGWAWVLSDLKTLVETGQAFAK
jgi:uncharacterized protein YndB with AHSA1/START domain